MEIIKTEKNMLLRNDHGDYHLSFAEFNRLGEAKAKDYAAKEIEKKRRSVIDDREIDFQKARDYGFCREGILDFCAIHNLDINSKYTLKYLRRNLKLQAFLRYPEEMFKLFGGGILDNFGGPAKLLTDNPTQDVLYFVLQEDIIEEKNLHLIACEFAERVLPLFRQQHPNDERPLEALKVKRLWLKGGADDKRLEAAGAAARVAVWDAARAARAAGTAAEAAAARAAEDAAEAAARAAARAAAGDVWDAARDAWDAARDAAWGAASAARNAARDAGAAGARDAETKAQIAIVLKYVK